MHSTRTHLRWSAVLTLYKLSYMQPHVLRAFYPGLMLSILHSVKILIFHFVLHLGERINETHMIAVKANAHTNPLQ